MADEHIDNGEAAVVAAVVLEAPPPPPQGPQPPPPGVPKTPPSKERLVARIDAYRTIKEDQRTVTQRWAAGLGAVGSALIGAVGITQVHDLLPLPPGTRGWVVGILAAIFTAMAIGGVMWLTFRFLRAREAVPVFEETLTPDDPLGQVNDNYDRLRGDERRHVEHIFRTVVARFRDPAIPDPPDFDLRHLTERANDLRRRGEVDLADRFDLLVDLAQVKAAAVVVEHRANRATSGWKTAAAAIIAVIGLLGVLTAADYSKSVRPEVNPAIAAANLKAAVLNNQLTAAQIPGARATAYNTGLNNRLLTIQLRKECRTLMKAGITSWVCAVPLRK